MTNSEIINKITAEIRNRLVEKVKEADLYYGQSSKSDTIEGEIIAYTDMLSIVSGLKENDSWKPSNIKKQGQKPAWSEEDDQLIGFIFDLLNDLSWRKDWAMSKEECLERLKSLRPSWKPSDHQMNILKAVKEYVGRGSGYWGEGLGSLIEDLEKLM